MIYRNSTKHVQIGTNVIQASNLSIEARFVLIYILSRPDNYHFSSGYSLAQEIKMTPYKCQNALRELTAAGYITRTRIHRNGRLAGNEWTILEEPNPQNIVTTPEEQPVVISAEEFTYRQLFEQFWSVYPKQVDRESTYKAFCNIKNIKEVFPRIIAALEVQIKDKQWKEENGRFIPYPEKYIKQSRWEDVVLPDAEAEAESMKDMMRIFNYEANS